VNANYVFPLPSHNPLLDARGISFARDIIRSFTSFLMFIANLHVAKHVDIDGFQEEDGQSPAHEAYMRTVLEARISVRALEATTQAIYDDNAILLATAQELPADVDERFSSANAACCARLDGVLITLEANATSALQILEKLVIIGSSQAGMADGEYRQSINLRMSKILTIEDTLRVSSRISRGINEDEVVAIEDAFAFSGNKLPRRVTPFDDNYHADSSRSQTASEHTPSASWDQSTQATDSIYDGDTIGAETDKMSPVDADDDEYERELFVSFVHSGFF
jgi:son of sevenless-like protein